jgi:HSP20 family protein
MLAKMNRRYVPAYWDDYFNDSFFKSYRYPEFKGQTPSVNVVEEEKNYRIDVAVPGMSRNDIQIELDNDVLTISSELKDSKEDKKPNYMRREFSYNSFKRSFQLPESVDQEKILARHESGVLSIELPKKEEEVSKAPKQIKIK